MSLSDLEGQNPSVAAGAIGSGNTTGSVEVLAAVADVKHRAFLECLSLGAAGSVTVKGGDTALSNKFLFAAKGTIYVGMLFEAAVNTAISLDGVLDAVPGADIPLEATYRYERH